MFRRKIKNLVYNLTPTEILVREATCCEQSWGPTNTLLSKIAELSNEELKMMEIMPIIWRRLKDTGRKWLHVYKSLLLIEFLILRGNPSITDHCRQHIHFLKSLENFQYRNEKNSEDVGIRIRRRVDQIMKLLKDEEHLKNERKIAINTDLRFSRVVVAQGSNVPIKHGNGLGSMSQGGSMLSFGGSTDQVSNSTLHQQPTSQFRRAASSTLPKSKSIPQFHHSKPTHELAPPADSIEEDIQLEIALAESKLEAEQEKLRQDITQLSDGYKIAIALNKNHIENKKSKSKLSSSASLSIKSSVMLPPPAIIEDPWSPFPPINQSINPTTIDNSAKYNSSSSPWTPFLPSPSQHQNTSLETCQPVSISSYTINNNTDPWTGHHADQSSLSTNYNISTKSVNNDVATKFLGNNSHLIDFDHLISNHTFDNFHNSSKSISNPDPNFSPLNPFLPSETSHMSTNPFLIQPLPNESIFQIDMVAPHKPISNSDISHNQLLISPTSHQQHHPQPSTSNQNKPKFSHNNYNPFLN